MKEELLKRAIEFIRENGLYEEFKESLPNKEEINEREVDEWAGFINN